MTPLTHGGKIFCMLFALVGIPWTMIIFTALVERLMLLSTKSFSLLLNHLTRFHHRLHCVQLLNLGLVLTVVFVLIFLIPSAVFTGLENDWSFLDSFYFCFISVTTVGLGDYIPAEDPNAPYRALYIFGTASELLVEGGPGEFGAVHKVCHAIFDDF